MNDDYLWDRSGEPDPDVERLERVLGEYRYRETSISPAIRSHFAWHRKPLVKFAVVAAAAILLVVAGLWIVRLQTRPQAETPDLRAGQQLAPQTQPEPQTQPQTQPTPGTQKLLPIEPEPSGKLAVVKKHARKMPRVTPDSDQASEPNVSEPNVGDSTFVAERQPIINPFIDVEIARHIERAQVLLRSFRNSRESSRQPDADLSYEKQGSRELLYRNVLLRRDAEAKGNLPVEELLGSLEPFLLDIANLPEKPSVNEVRSIKERMQKKEIVSALQIYSAPILSRAF
jgi:hypothetical protein